MRNWLMFVPPVLFAALALAFYAGMQRTNNPGELPSTFIGQPAPALGMETLPGLAALSQADLTTGKITVVNFWASWCLPCRAEHPVLTQMARDGLRVAGVNIKDASADAQTYLAREGNPFFALTADPKGRMAIDWGVTAPPETFIVGGDGVVLFRFQGPLVGSDYEQRFLPALQAAVASQP
jgi:cytochrome c biogenesis protein CcmG, thiol:disulfide interchange protein DsbE